MCVKNVVIDVGRQKTLHELNTIHVYHKFLCFCECRLQIPNLKGLLESRPMMKMINLQLLLCMWGKTPT